MGAPRPSAARGKIARNRRKHAVVLREGAPVAPWRSRTMGAAAITPEPSLTTTAQG